MSLPACTAWLPGFLCSHGDILLYLVPSVATAFLFWMLSGAHPAFFLLTAPGTLCHELAHFGVGLLTNAEPTNISLFPRRKGKVWELGSVTFSNLRCPGRAGAFPDPGAAVCCRRLAHRSRLALRAARPAAGRAAGAPVPVLLALAGRLAPGGAFLALATCDRRCRRHVPLA